MEQVGDWSRPLKNVPQAMFEFKGTKIRGLGPEVDGPKRLTKASEQLLPPSTHKLSGEANFSDKGRMP